jgi:hypothetical protein
VGVFSLQKYLKIILKSLQKVVDKSKKMCYYIDTTEGNTPKRRSFEK